jgi:hypothetical protein
MVSTIFVIDNEMAMNIDIGTMIDAAGLPDTFHMDGTSIESFMMERQSQGYSMNILTVETPIIVIPFTGIHDFNYNTFKTIAA